MKKTRIRNSKRHVSNNKKSFKLIKKNNRRKTRRKQLGGKAYNTLKDYGMSNGELVSLDGNSTGNPDVNITPRSSSIVGEAGAKGEQSYIPDTEFEENNEAWLKISENNKSNANSSGMFSWVSKLIEWFVDLMTPTGK
jgi:hypothetical protein